MVFITRNIPDKALLGFQMLLHGEDFPILKMAICEIKRNGEKEVKTTTERYLILWNR